ncbi:MAG: ester cyclase [Bacteroidota bacterium]
MKKLILALAIAGLFASCNGTTTNNAGGADSTVTKMEKNKETALASQNALIAKDVDAMFKDCAPGFVDYGSGEYPPANNIDSIKASMKSFLAAYPDLKGDSLVALANNNTVAVTGTWSGTFTNDFMGIKATNKKFKTPDVDIFTFNDQGQITSHRSVQQMATFFSQVGIKFE